MAFILEMVKNMDKIKAKKMFDFFHDVIQDIADESPEWSEAFTEEYDKIWNEDEINWNKVREDLNETLESYSSIINLEDDKEISALGNDIISVFKKHYFGD